MRETQFLFDGVNIRTSNVRQRRHQQRQGMSRHWLVGCCDGGEWRGGGRPVGEGNRRWGGNFLYTATVGNALSTCVDESGTYLWSHICLVLKVD